MSGIYQIRNIINNKIYVGSTVCFKNRWAVHLFLLDRNKHGNSHLQSAWNKYGKDNFIFEILEEEVSSIRKLWAEGKYEQKELSLMFKIAQSQISRIINCKIWTKT